MPITFVRAPRALLALLLALGPILTTPAARAAEQLVTITESLDPQQLTVVVGTTVRWDNAHDERHRVRSRSGPVEFDSGNLDPGQSFAFTFTAVGSYPYLDDRDPDNAAYHGTIEVTAEAPPPPGDDPQPPPGPDPPPPAAGDVSIVNRLYQPGSLTVGVGATVTWANNDDRVHTVTAFDGSFDSGLFDTGGIYSRTFTTAGTFDYFCVVHPDMVASVTVVGDGTEPPPSEPPPPPPAPPPADPPSPVASDIAIVDFDFTPSAATINVGDTITWGNSGAAPHTVTDRGGSFDSGFLATGDTFARTFTTAGTFDYFCTLHPEMVGRVTVLAPDGTAPPPAPPIPPPASATPAAPAAPVSGDVSVGDNTFSPRTLQVPTGTTVSWANNGELAHTITAADGSFDSGFVMPGSRYRRTFNAAGTFDYLCTIHPGMTGRVVVTGATVAGATEGGGTEATAAGLGAVIDPAPPPPTSAPSPEGVAADIVDLDFEPPRLTVAPGTVVTWTNRGQLPHTVTAVDGSYDSGFLQAGDIFSMEFTEPGTYEYLCTLHPTMVGTVVVEAAGPPADAAPAAAPEEPAALTAVLDPPVATAPPEPWSPLPALLIGVSLVAVAAVFVGAGGGFARPTHE